MMRVFYFVLLGGLELVLGDPALAQEAPAAEERGAAFEFAIEAKEAAEEDSRIFAPLSPVLVEAESVQLPQDQRAD